MLRSLKEFAVFYCCLGRVKDSNKILLCQNFTTTGKIYKDKYITKQ
jgi:hypothetical protein